MWPVTASELIRAQHELAAARPPAWRPAATRPLVAACFVCFERGSPGATGEHAWAAAVLMHGNRGEAGAVVVDGTAGAAYEPGLLALREGPLLEAALRALPALPAVLLVNGTGRDHPRRAGLALHLGAELGLPSVGVTDRPLHAEGPDAGPERGATSSLTIDGREVARRLRTRAGARPVVVHAGWATDLDTAVAIVLAATRRARTPEPLRRARREARRARAAA